MKESRNVDDDLDRLWEEQGPAVLRERLQNANKEAKSMATALKAVVSCLEGEGTWMEPYPGVLEVEGNRYPREDQILERIKWIKVGSSSFEERD